MIRGTTPTHHFNLPFEASMISAVRAIYKQGTKEVLRKETPDFRLEGQRVSVDLTQEETFLFDCRTPVKLQLRVKTIRGQVLNTRTMVVSVAECLDSEVL